VYDDFEDPDLARALVFKPFSLIDLTTLPESVIRQHGVASLMEMLLKYTRERDFARAISQLQEGDTLTITLTQTTEPYLQTVVKYALSSAWSENQAEKVLEVFYKALPDKREVIMSAAQQLIERDMQASHADVWRTAERKAKLEDARKMRLRGLNNELIKDITSLTDSDLLHLEDGSAESH
jgi:predicted transposase YdaD